MKGLTFSLGGKELNFSIGGKGLNFFIWSERFKFIINVLQKGYSYQQLFTGRERVKLIIPTFHHFTGRDRVHIIQMERKG